MRACHYYSYHKCTLLLSSPGLWKTICSYIQVQTLYCNTTHKTFFCYKHRFLFIQLTFDKTISVINKNFYWSFCGFVNRIASLAVSPSSFRPFRQLQATSSRLSFFCEVCWRSYKRCNFKQNSRGIIKVVYRIKLRLESRAFKHETPYIVQRYFFQKEHVILFRHFLCHVTPQKLFDGFHSTTYIPMAFEKWPLYIDQQDFK